MRTHTYANLKDARERLVGYEFLTVVRATGIRRERLTDIEERGAEPTVFEIEALARVYGLTVDQLVEEPIRMSAGDAVAILTSLDEFRHVSDPVRLRIVECANAARDLVRLQRLIDQDASQGRGALPELPAPTPNGEPFRIGADHALALREQFGLGMEPIPSVRDLVSEWMSGIHLLYANLGSDGPAGLCFADDLRGPTVVLNLDGKNRNACVRRFSLAHEIYHLLVDWNRAEPLAVLSGYFSEQQLEREQRANAFAVRLLCPEPVLEQLSRDKPIDAARLLRTYGLHYAAVQLYLKKARGIDLPPRPPPGVAALGEDEVWEVREAPTGIENFPLTEVHAVRRTLVARAAALAYSLGKIPRDEFAEILGVSPLLELEIVLDYFAMDQPPGADVQ